MPLAMKHPVYVLYPLGDREPIYQNLLPRHGDARPIYTDAVAELEFRWGINRHGDPTYENLGQLREGDAEPTHENIGLPRDGEGEPTYENLGLPQGGEGERIYENLPLPRGDFTLIPRLHDVPLTVKEISILPFAPYLGIDNRKDLYQVKGLVKDETARQKKRAQLEPARQANVRSFSGGGSSADGSLNSPQPSPVLQMPTSQSPPPLPVPIAFETDLPPELLQQGSNSIDNCGLTLPKRSIKVHCEI